MPDRQYNVPESISRNDFVEAIAPLCALLNVNPCLVDSRMTIGPRGIDFAVVASRDGLAGIHLDDAPQEFSTLFYPCTVRIAD